MDSFDRSQQEENLFSCSEPTVKIEEKKPYELSDSTKNSPYYLACIEAFEEAKSRKTTPYLVAYWGAKNDYPLSYDAEEKNPSFYEAVYNQPRQVTTFDSNTPYLEAYCRANTYKPYPLVEDYDKLDVNEFNGQEIFGATPKALERDNEYVSESWAYKKRPFIMILILVLALLCILVPVMSSLKIADEFINIGEDVLSISDITKNISIDTIKGNIPLISLSVYTLFSIMLLVMSIFALAFRVKMSFVIIALITFLSALTFTMVTHPNPKILEQIVSEIPSFIDNIGKLAMLVLPIIVMLLARLCYKRVIVKI